MNNLFIKNKKYLYLISPSNLLSKELPLKNFLIILNKILKTKKIRIFQLRLKNKKKIQILNSLKEINLLCKKYKTLCFINDYVDKKILNFCDGVHLGQKDLSKNKIKKIIEKKKFIGITCHNSNVLAKKALKYKPNYISFRSIFPSETKKNKYYAKIKNINVFKKKFDIPCAVIGGINTANCKKILKTKCDLYAVSSGVWNFEKGPLTAVNLLYKILNKK